MKPATERLLCESHRPHLALALECLSSSIPPVFLSLGPGGHWCLQPHYLCCNLPPHCCLHLRGHSWDHGPNICGINRIFAKRNTAEFPEEKEEITDAEPHVLSLSVTESSFCGCYGPRCLKTSFLRMFKTSFFEEGTPCPRLWGRGTTEEFLSP